MRIKDLKAVLACPICKKSNFKINFKKIICENCNKRFNFIFKKKILIPNFIIDLKNQLRRNPKEKNLIVNIISKNKSYLPKKTKLISLDLGCGETPRGDYNVDCFIPNSIPKNFILANTERLPFKKKSFDIVYSFYNIEHITNPAEYLKKIYEISKKEIYIVTDNSEWVGDIFFRLIGSGRIYHKEHCFKWSKEYMENLLKRIGIKKYYVSLENHSFSPLVKFFYLFSKIIPKLKYFVARDLVITIKK
jgi:SAM-dependent methyltransferase